MMTNIVYTRINDSSILVIGSRTQLQADKNVNTRTESWNHDVTFNVTPSHQPSTPSSVFELGSVCCLSNVLFLFVCMQLQNQLVSAERDQMKKTTFMNKWTKPILEMYTLFPADKMFCFQNQSRAPAGLSL